VIAEALGPAMADSIEAQTERQGDKATIARLRTLRIRFFNTQTFGRIAYAACGEPPAA